MSARGQVAIQHIGVMGWRVRFRRSGKLVSWYFGTVAEAIEAASGILRGEP